MFVKQGAQTAELRLTSNVETGFRLSGWRKNILIRAQIDGTVIGVELFGRVWRLSEHSRQITLTPNEHFNPSDYGKSVIVLEFL